MSKAPAFQLFAGDFLSDTLTWSARELGVHIRLMCWSWDNGPIPEDPKRRNRIDPDCGACWSTVGTKWSSDGNGGLVNARLEKTREDQREYRERQSSRGKRSAEKRWGNHCLTSVTPALQPEHQPNGNNKEGVDVDTTLKEKERAKEMNASFTALWTTYEGYGAKGKALAYWKRLSEEERAAIIAKAPAYVASTPGCAYRKQLEGWINPDNRLWERPIVTKDQPPPTAPPKATGWLTKTHVKTTQG